MQIGIPIGLSAWRQAGTGETTYPANFQSVNSDGWSTTYASPPTLDPVGSPEIFTVSRAGYDASGTGVTVTENLTLMSRVREPYPNQATLTASTVAVNDFIYSTDTIAGVTNNSTRVAPKPVARWLNRDLEEISGSTHVVRLSVAHPYGRNGRPVAAVKFRISDGTNTAEATVSTLTFVSYAASGLGADCYEGTVDVSTLTQGATLTIDAVIYPWVGAAFTISTDADTYPSPNLTTLRALCNRTGALGVPYAYVTVGATGGAVSTNPVTAAAAPFPTVIAAATAIKAFNGGTNADRGVIRLNTGTHVHASFRTQANTTTWPLTIEAADVANKATTIYQAAAVTTASSVPDFLVIKDVILQRGGAGALVFLDNAAGNLTYTNYLCLSNCTFSINGAALYDGLLYRTGRMLMINCDGDNVGQYRVTGVVNKTINAIGCVGVEAATCYSSIASRAFAFVNCAATTGRPASVGAFFYNNFISNGTTTGAIVDLFNVGNRGFAIVGNVIESWGTVTNVLLKISGDTYVDTVRDAIVYGNTCVGQRLNALYNDTGVSADKSGFFKNNIFRTQNIKSDVFSTATLTGNWAARYKTGWSRNAILRGSEDGLSTYSAASWLGDIAGLGSVNGSSASPLVVNWASDRSNDGTDAGGGDYTPGSTNSLPTIPAGQTHYAHDLLGRSVASSGTALVGAVQRT